MSFLIQPIGYVHSTRSEPSDDNWEAEQVYVELCDPFTEEALIGLGDFSHVEILFLMHLIDPDETVTGARHPRGNSAWPKVGVFAQRHRKRPNRVGTTVAKITKIAGRRIYLEGLDAIDGTPVIDIKPWVKELGPRGEVRQPSWMTELMKPYWRTGEDQ